MPISAIAARQSAKSCACGEPVGAHGRKDHEERERPPRAEPVEGPSDRELGQREGGEPDRRHRAEIGRVEAEVAAESSPATMARNARKNWLST